MKNLFLAITLLTQPYDAFIYNETSTTISATMTYGETERTNASNNYYIEHDAEISTDQIYCMQRFGTETTLNNYYDIKAYNYCRLNYNYDDSNYNDTYYLTTFFILQTRAYERITSTNMNVEIQLDCYLGEISGDDGTRSKEFEIEIFNANTNLASMINTSNWNYWNAVDDMYNEAKTKSPNKTELYQEETEQTQLSISLASSKYTKTLYSVPITTGQTSYIFGLIRLNQTIEKEDYRGYETPDENTKLLHTSKLVITSQKNLSPITYEVVDIAGLMFTILGMPFSFISQAFNLTLFPNTPYEINISNILLGFIAIALLLWVLKLILGKADIGGWLADQKANYNSQKKFNNRVSELKKNQKISKTTTTKEDKK